MILIPTYSPVSIQNGACQIDRKFHTGTCLYAERLPEKIVVLAPQISPSDHLMDGITVALEELPYRVEAVACDASFQLDSFESSRVEALVQESSFIYGMGFNTQNFASKLGKPFIPILEYNLRTQIQVATLSVSGSLRRTVRTLKTIFRYAKEVMEFRKAQSIHCNGYPIFEEVNRFHPAGLLYLDSRMYEDMVISAEALDERLSSLATRRPRLIYSGRYEPMKGALDVVEVGVELLRMGVDFDLDLYGKGHQAQLMQDRVRKAAAGDRIRVHDAVSYPQLMKISRASDLFVCCHVQDDPSCSYIEAFGAGLAVAGYDNRMWRSLSREAETGIVTRLGNSAECAIAIAALLRDKERFARYSLRAREFALAHCFEREFSKRIEAILPLCTE